MTRRTKFAAALAIGFACLITVRSGDPIRVLPASAQRFVRYYQAAGSSEAQVGPLRRVLFSLAMANYASRNQQRAGARSRPHPWSETATF
jgi:hypothetical protein